MKRKRTLTKAQLRQRKTEKVKRAARLARMNQRIKEQAKSTKSVFARRLGEMSLNELRILETKLTASDNFKHRVWKLNALKTEINRHISLGEDSESGKEFEPQDQPDPKLKLKEEFKKKVKGRKKWSDEELQAAIEAYIDMMAKSKAGEHFTKKEYYESLTDQFGRTPKAFEFRMQNISAVLNELGRHWLGGLPPAKNVGTGVIKRIVHILEHVEGQKLKSDVGFHSEVENHRKKPPKKKPDGRKKPGRSNATVTQYERSPEITAWVLNESEGVCESCEKPAPFNKSKGSPYLEVHHIRRLADGGSDTTENAVALCPNCHMEFHYGENKADKANALYDRITRLVKE